MISKQTKSRMVDIACVASVPFFLAAQLKSQILHLAGIGMRVMVLTAPGPELEQFPWSESLVHEPVDIRRRPAPWRDLRALFQIIRIFQKKQPIIVHSTTPKAGLLTAVAAWLVRTPIRLHTFTGQQWVTMSGPLRWVSRWSDRLVGRLSTRVYADSPSQREFLIAQGIIRAEKIGVIGAGSLAGVDVRRFNKDRFNEAERRALKQGLGIEPGAVVITFIGRITREKGVQELLQSASTLREEGVSFHLILAGPLDSALEVEPGLSDDTTSGQLSSSSNIHVIGYTKTPEAYLAISDILCLPSYREGFGTVVIEAAAMGVPTIGTRITGLSDAVVDEVTGLLVPAQDTEALTLTLRRLINDPVLRRRLGDASRQRCHEQFDSDVVNQKLTDEYARLLMQAGVSLQ